MWSSCLVDLFMAWAHPFVLFAQLWHWNSEHEIHWNLSFRYILFHEKHSFSDIINNMIRDINRLHSWYWSIHTKDESKRETAFAFIFGVNWLWHGGVTALFSIFFQLTAPIIFGQLHFLLISENEIFHEIKLNKTWRNEVKV